MRLALLRSLSENNSRIVADDAFDEALRTYSLLRVLVMGDENGLFRCFALVSRLDHASLRRMVVQQVLRHKRYYLRILRTMRLGYDGTVPRGTDENVATVREGYVTGRDICLRV